jgi:type II secretory pathway predicted ATPase ExeA
LDYLDFYQLTQEPFSNAPVSRFYYASEQHMQALVRLKYAVESMKGLAILSGGIGAGKTTLARRFLDSLDDKEYEAALLIIIHSGVTADWLLNRIAIQLGVEHPERDKLALLSQLYRRLIEIYESGKKAVVLIDEAQMLATRELMEEFRGLLNLEVPERKLLSFVFFGLPEIDTNIMLDPPLAQRVAVRCRLTSLDQDSTREYVGHRLKVAGATRMLLDPSTFPIIYAASRGVPRVINTICDNALLEGSLANVPVVGPEIVEAVVRNLDLPTDGLPHNLPPSHDAAALDAFLNATALSLDQALPPVQLPDDASDPALDEIDRVLANLKLQR